MNHENIYEGSKNPRGIQMSTGCGSWRNAFLLLAVLLLASDAIALTILTDKLSYVKGDVIAISGACSAGNQNLVIGLNGEKKIFEEDIECSEEEEFSFDYQSSFLDPEGNWELRLSTPEESAKINVVVENKREAGFYFIKVLNPTIGKYSRAEKLDFSVEVTDAGTLVADARVVLWGVKGERIEFRNSGSGVYNVEYTVLVDAPLGSWKVLLLAETVRGQERIGGRNNELEMVIEKAPISIDVLEPKTTTFELGTRIPVRINATYFNGSGLPEESIATARVDGKEITLSRISSSEFAGMIEIEQSGSLEVEITVDDQSENITTKTLNLVAGCSVTCLITNYGLYIIAVVLVGLVAFQLFVGKVSYGSELSKLEKEKQKNLELIVSLQKEYFSKGVMPANSYKKNLAEYKARLAELEEK